jgi:DNA primase
MPTLKSDAPTLVLTNRNKVSWPDEGYTKRDLLDYHREIAPHRHVELPRVAEFSITSPGSTARTRSPDSWH